jgi:ribosomal protein S15P/S13E
MADNYLEKHKADYEERKALWLKNKQRNKIKKLYQKDTVKEEKKE